MRYPPDTLEHEVELFLNSSWRDVSGDVLSNPGISIKRGRPDQSATPGPGSCSFILRNDAGDYSPRWPIGQWYGSIGQNTPLRVATIVSRDAFGRTASNGWGSDDYSSAWTSGGSGGTVAAANHNVGSGVGTISVPTTNAYRYDYLGSLNSAVVDVRADVTLTFSNVTGASVYPLGIMLRGQSTSSYYHVRTEITTAEAVTIGVFLADGTTIAAAVTVSGLTHTSSQTLRVRAQAEGHTIRGKVWAASGNEPYGWHITVHDETVTSSGFVGVRCGVATSNSNTLPVVYSIDNVRVRVPLCSNEISSLVPGWDTSGNFVTAEVTAGGPLQRLGRGAALQSSLRRGYLRDLDHPPLIYWPCEDANDGVTYYFAPAIGNLPLLITSGTPNIASLTPFDSSGALPAVNFSSWIGQIPGHTPGRCQVRFIVGVPSGGLGIGLRRLMVIATTGTVKQFSIFIDQNGDLWIYAYDSTLTALHISGPVDANLNGTPGQVAVEWEQTTATNVNINLISLHPGDASVSQIGPSGANIVGSQTVGFATAIVVDPDVLLPDTVSMGHISFHTTAETVLNLSGQLNAWKSETAGDRAERLGIEERLPVAYIGTLSDSEEMGPQRALELQKLLYECQSTDLGELFESRGEAGLTMRVRSSLLNQDAAITLDYSNGEISEPFVPVDDDQFLKNDVTISRQGGSSWRSVLETGRLSVLPPEDGGSGRYDETATLNVYADVQLSDLSGWIRYLGTVDEARYPIINLDLANRNLVAAGLQSAVLDLDIGDRLLIENPKVGQTVDPISQIIVGQALQLDQYKFVASFNCVPETPYQVGILDDTDKRVDSDSTTLTNNVTNSATSFQVTIVSGSALWTTASGDMPMLIRVGGEIMSVGSVTGTSSPQTFGSITRSVNGVVKAHLAAAVVKVAYPFVLS